jgi:uncharacterized protein YggL (DUF469 family)
MEATKPIAVVLALVVVTAATVYCAQEPPEPAAGATPAGQISNTRTASCLVKITADAAIIALDEFIIESLLRSSSVAGTAAKEVLGVSPDDTSALFTIEDLTHSDSGGSGVPSASSRAPKGGLGGYETEEETGYDIMMYEDMMMDRSSTAPAGEPRPSRPPYTSRPTRTPARGTARDTTSTTPARTPTRDTARDTTSRTPARTTTARTPARRIRGGYDAIYGSDWHISTSPDDGYYYYGRGSERSTTRRNRTTAPSTSAVAQQTLLFRLSVDLPEGIKPAAREFMDALIDNLKHALDVAYEGCRRRFAEEIGMAMDQRREAEGELSELNKDVMRIYAAPVTEDVPANSAVYRQLDEIVDLSVLTPNMPFVEAIEEIKNSVEPPLKIVLLWRDLLAEAEIEPTTEINMDGVGAVALGKGLELLLKAVSGRALDEVGYEVDNGIVTIAAAESLPRRLKTWVYYIPALAHAAGDGDLVELIQETVEPDSWYEAGGEGTIRTYMGKKLAILQTHEIHLKIQDLLEELLRAATVSASADVPADVSVQMLLQEKHSLLREKQTLELDVARLEARRPAIEEQVPLIRMQAERKIHNDPIVNELQRLLDLQVQLVERTKELVKEGRVSHSEFADAEGKVARAKIELARRREELSKSAGGDQLAKFANDLTTLTIDLTEKKAELQVLSKQLDQTQKQLTALSASDPQISKIRLVTQALEMADRRVNELEARLAYLQEPTVTVLGAD